MNLLGLGVVVGAEHIDVCGVIDGQGLDFDGHDGRSERNEEIDLATPDFDVPVEEAGPVVDQDLQRDRLSEVPQPAPRV